MPAKMVPARLIIVQAGKVLVLHLVLVVIPALTVEQYISIVTQAGVVLPVRGIVRAGKVLVPRHVMGHKVPARAVVIHLLGMLPVNTVKINVMDKMPAKRIANPVNIVTVLPFMDMSVLRVKVVHTVTLIVLVFVMVVTLLAMGIVTALLVIQVVHGQTELVKGLAMFA